MLRKGACGGRTGGGGVEEEQGGMLVTQEAGWQGCSWWLSCYCHIYLLFVHWFNCSSALQPVQITFCQLQGAGDNYDILPAPGTPDRQVIGNYQEEPAVRVAAGPEGRGRP